MSYSASTEIRITEYSAWYYRELYLDSETIYDAFFALIAISSRYQRMYIATLLFIVVESFIFIRFTEYFNRLRRR